MAKGRTCRECWQTVEIGKAHNCKPVKPEPEPTIPEVEPEPIQRPIESKPSNNGLECPEKAKSRALLWQKENRERYNAYMREYMKRKREKAKQK